MWLRPNLGDEPCVRAAHAAQGVARTAFLHDEPRRLQGVAALSMRAKSTMARSRGLQKLWTFVGQTPPPAAQIGPPEVFAAGFLTPAFSEAGIAARDLVDANFTWEEVVALGIDILRLWKLEEVCATFQVSVDDLMRIPITQEDIAGGAVSLEAFAKHGGRFEHLIELSPDLDVLDKAGFSPAKCASSLGMSPKHFRDAMVARQRDPSAAEQQIASTGGWHPKNIDFHIPLWNTACRNQPPNRAVVPRSSQLAAAAAAQLHHQASAAARTDHIDLML